MRKSRHFMATQNIFYIKKTLKTLYLFESLMLMMTKGKKKENARKIFKERRMNVAKGE